MIYTELPARGVICLKGADRIAFLQGIISGDAQKLARGEAMYAALLSPQGKYLHDFFLVSKGDSVLIDCEKARADDLMLRLSRYKLRSQVTLEKSEEKLFAFWGEGNPSGSGLIFADPRLSALGARMIGGKPEGARADFSAYDRMRLTLGVPDGSRDMIEGRSILLEFGFEELHGVDFEKGCYVGQEVTARSKHRAQLKKGLYQIEADAPLPPAGTPIMAGEVQAGEMRSSAGDIGLAILRFEEVKKDGALIANNVSIRVKRPSWIKE